MAGSDPLRLEGLKVLQERANKLEEQARITETMTRAREGHFIPWGLDDRTSTPAEYFADEFDYFRSRARDAYFSVQDADLRRALITTQREIEAHVNENAHRFLYDAEREVRQLEGQREPWLLAGLLAVGAVIVGAWTYETVGGIAGAVGGLFLGRSVIEDFRRRGKSELADAKKRVEEARGDLAEQGNYPECFSQMEEATGERDRTLDDQRALGNILQSEARMNRSGRSHPASH